MLCSCRSRPAVEEERARDDARLRPRGEPIYALEGSVFVAAAVRGCATSRQIGRAARRCLALAGPDNQGVYLVRFVGLGAPWQRDARLLVGLTGRDPCPGPGGARSDRVPELATSSTRWPRTSVGAPRCGARDLAGRRRRGGERLPHAVPADVLGSPWIVPASWSDGAAAFLGLGVGLWTPGISSRPRPRPLFRPK
jgi:hypothetical protein